MKIFKLDTWAWTTLTLLMGLNSMLASADAPLDDELSQAMALEGDLQNGKEVFTTCAACHTTEGWGTEDGRFPQLAGQHRSVIIKQMADIRAGNRDNPEMFPFAKEEAIGGPQAIADVTAYIATLPMSPTPAHRPGDLSEKDKAKAERMYFSKCGGCHGVNGEGDDEKFYPRIQGQHYEYLLRQLKWIQTGKRRNADKVMMRKIERLKPADFELLADYISRIQPPADLVAEPGWKNPDFWKK